MALFKKITFTLKGLTPMILHNGRMADPLNEYAKKLKKISGKRAKTDDDHIAMSEIEWEAGLYWHREFPDAGLYMPSENLYAAIIKASKKLKLGTSISAVMMSDPIGYAIKTKYKTLDEMRADPQTWFKKLVTVQTSKLMRTRPMVHDWSIDVECELDHSILGVDQLEEILKICGKVVGLGDWRPGSPKSPGFYGRFAVSNFEAKNDE